jgi:hypothetical protein
MKICNICEIEKSKCDFYKGHACCKDCYKAKVKNYQLNNKSKIQAYEKSRASLPHRVKARKEYSTSKAGLEAGRRAKTAWAERNAIKRGASTMVRKAVREGKLIKPSHCSDCECEHNRLHGHHDDYSKPLDVRWLCPTCHNQWHKINGAGLNG